VNNYSDFDRLKRLNARLAAIRLAGEARCCADLHYPRAQKIRVVLDNLSTQSAASLYNSFAPPEARRIMSKIEVHYTPKHASWLNMVEIEIGVLRTMCLYRRIEQRSELESEIATWERRRNASREKIQ
jgi:DDE superfamily endonuclease